MTDSEFGQCEPHCVRVCVKTVTLVDDSTTFFPYASFMRADTPPAIQSKCGYYAGACVAVRSARPIRLLSLHAITGNDPSPQRIWNCMKVGNLTGKLIVALLLAASTAWAQHISVGIVGGVPFTGSFSDSSFATAGVEAGEVFDTKTYTNSNNYLLGPMVEVRLPLNLAIEVDALYRPLNLVTQSQEIVGPSATPSSFQSSQTFSSWEFPVLGKFRLPLAPVIKPFIEAGPNFRAVSSSLPWLSKDGFVIGGGVEVKILRLRIAPAIRYTRWGSDSKQSGLLFTPGSGSPALTYLTPPPSKQNQAEFLVGLSF
jgi:hypothetical protein